MTLCGDKRLLKQHAHDETSQHQAAEEFLAYVSIIRVSINAIAVTNSRGIKMGKGGRGNISPESMPLPLPSLCCGYESVVTGGCKWPSYYRTNRTGSTIFFGAGSLSSNASFSAVYICFIVLQSLQQNVNSTTIGAHYWLALSCGLLCLCLL